jgi:hypothetical protein
VGADEVAGEMGLHALEVTVKQADGQGALLFGRATHVDLALRPAVREGARVEVELVDARGGEVRGGVVRAPIDQPVKVLFKLTSEADLPKIAVEVYAPTRRAEEVSPARSQGHFFVTRVGGRKPTSSADAPAPQVAPDAQASAAAAPVVAPAPGAGLGDEISELLEYSGWENLPQDGTQQVFEHIARHGSITEAEVRHMLGSGRQYRRFSRRIEEYVTKVSFDLRVETVGGTKRYVREES